MNAAPSSLQEKPASPKTQPTRFEQSDLAGSHGSKKRPSLESNTFPRSTKKPKVSQSDSESPSQLSSPPTSPSQAEEVAKKPLKRKAQPRKHSARSTSHLTPEGTDTISKRRVKQQDTKSELHLRSKTEVERTPATGVLNRNLSRSLDSQSELSSVPEMEDPPPDPKNPMKQDSPSEGEMSPVLDETHKQNKRRRAANESSAQGSRKAPKSKAQAGSEISPDDVEIKRLQGWLVKCGIRKLWGKELKPYETSKGKIKHLRKLLEDVGMTGRFSMEKAREIREKRELAADLAEVQDRTQRWGKAESSDPDTGGKPRRRLVRGSRTFDFLNESDGEETD